VAEYKFHVLHFFKSKTPEIKWLKIKHHFLGFFRVYCFSSVSEMNSSQTNQDWQVKYSDYIINNYTKLIKRLASLFYSNACLKFVSFKTVRLLWRKLIPSVLLKIVLLFTSTSIVSLFPLISIASGGQAEAFQFAPIKKKNPGMVKILKEVFISVSLA
jgi:hypothetical protein